MKKMTKIMMALLMLSTPFIQNEINKVDAASTVVWLENHEEITDYEYSFAVVGDTQIVSQDYPDAMHTMYKWIVDNQEEKNIQYVFGLGDITEGDADWEWANDKVAISQLNEADIPYSLIRGNHDTTAKFFNTFGNEEYMSQFLGFYKEDYINASYRTLKVGNTNFLLLTLDYGADDGELTWAGNVIEKFPDHKVIITTHCYLDENGNQIDDSHGTAPSSHNDDDHSTKDYNNGEEIWDKLVSKYGNIVLVMGGHISSHTIPVNQHVGIHGNVVTEMLINPQTEFDVDIEGGCAMVAMLYFDKDFTKIQVEYYSTIRDQYAQVQEEIDISGSGSQAHKLVMKNNDIYHWGECECGRKMVEELEEHTFKNDCQSRCDSCSFTRETTHSYDTYGYDDNGHYKKCDSCGEIDESTKVNHIYDADCDSSCNMCGYVRSVEHNYSVHTKDSEYHYDECSVCGNEATKVSHVYDNDCDTTCNTCSYERFITHDYSILVENENGIFKQCSICGDLKEVTKGKNNAPLIIGLSVGGVVLVSGLTTLLLFIRKKKM